MVGSWRLRGIAVGIALLAAGALAPAQARAGNGPFFVVYDHTTHEPGETEVMPMLDIASEPDGEVFAAYMLELDIGLLERWQLDIMAEGHLAESDGELRPTGFRLETRYRLFDRIPLNPVVYVEYEDLDVRTRYQMEVSGRHDAPEEAEEGRPRERVLESRLILSDELGPVRLSANWINESDLNGFVTAFGYAVGASVPICGRKASRELHAEGAGAHAGHAEHGEHGGSHGSHGGHGACGRRVGAELYGAAGDNRDFGFDPATREHYLSVNAMWHFEGGWMVKTAGSIGLTDVSRDLFRAGVGYEF